MIAELSLRPRITNRMRLPDAIVRAVSAHRYSKGDCDFSATELIGPARIRALRKRHEHEIVEDAADLLYAHLGSMGHAILQELAGDGVAEERLFADIDGVRVSGQLDLMRPTPNAKESDINDYKYCSVWVAMKGGCKFEWKAQMNIYRWLARRNGVPIRNAAIIAIFRDWSATKAGKNGHPAKQVKVFKTPDWGTDRTEKYLRWRIREHTDAATSLPKCWKFEHWGERRCKHYCNVSQWCDQRNKSTGAKPTDPSWIK